MNSTYFFYYFYLLGYRAGLQKVHDLLEEKGQLDDCVACSDAGAGQVRKRVQPTTARAAGSKSQA